MAIAICKRLKHSGPWLSRTMRFTRILGRWLSVLKLLFSSTRQPTPSMVDMIERGCIAGRDD